MSMHQWLLTLSFSTLIKTEWFMRSHTCLQWAHLSLSPPTSSRKSAYYKPSKILSALYASSHLIVREIPRTSLLR